MLFMKQVFDTKPVNKGRQPEVDLAKAVVTFLLAFIHCTIECTAEENLVSGIPYLFDTIIGGPLAAPMLMFAMGIGMVYTRNSDARELAKKGIRLEMTGFALNVCRYTIPFLIGYAVTAEYEKYMEPLLYRTLCNDVLQFAGIAILLMALLKYFRVSDAFLWLISLGMSLVGMFLNGIDVGNPPGNIFFGYLVGTEDAAGMVFSDFPLFNWFIVPVSGYLFGKCLIRVRDKKRFYGLLSPICILVTVLYFTRGILNETGMFGEGQNCYYHITTDDVFVSIAAAIGMLGIYAYLVRWIPERWMYRINDISRNITSIYCIHWVIITFTVNVLIYVVRGTQELTVPVTMVLSFAVSISAIAAAHVRSERGGYKG